ncbi:MAG: DHHA1 domain-containing protein, partial [Ginsengibacter sp.]
VSKLPKNISGNLIARINKEKRKNIKPHHTATHLLHAALRKTLGGHVAQKGSLVNEENLRFDFSHFAKVTDEELVKIEAIINEKIRENIPVVIKEMNKQEAIEMGAMALFGEKYGDKVRVVIMDPDYSIELCGGTHAGSTGELGFFKITHETAVGAGVRRIEAVSGLAAETYINKEFDLVRNLNEKLKNPKDLPKSIENLLAENSALKKELEKMEARQLSVLKGELLQKVEVINDVNFIGEKVDVSNAEALKKLCISLKSEMDNYFILLLADIESKPAVALMIDDQLSKNKNLDAPKIIKEHIAPLIKGGGGGQKTFASAGGQDASKLSEVVQKVKGIL